MNRKQWAILAAGGVLAVAAVDLGSIRPQPPVPLPTVEELPGLYRHSYVDVVVPPSAVLAFLAVVALTGFTAYSCRTRPAP